MRHIFPGIGCLQFSIEKGIEIGHIRTVHVDDGLAFGKNFTARVAAGERKRVEEHAAIHF